MFRASAPGVNSSPGSTAGVEQPVRERRARRDLGVLLEPALLAVYEDRHLRGKPDAVHGLVPVEADVVGACGIALPRLEQAHEHQPLFVDPELARAHIPGRGADDVDGAAVPCVLVHGREVEPELGEPRDGPVYRVEVHVEAEHHQRVHERDGAGQPAVAKHELGVAHEQQARPRVRGLELDPQPPGERGVFPPHRVFGATVRARGRVLLDETERAVPLARVAVVHRLQDVASRRGRRAAEEQRA